MNDDGKVSGGGWLGNGGDGPGIEADMGVQILKVGVLPYWAT